MKHLNIEIKAKAADHENARNFLQSQGAEFKGVDYQTDTYFKVTNGRLKLREGNIENHLIHYFRTDGKEPKESDVSLFKTSERAGLKELLSRALGVKTVVRKQREIYFIENVKFHLDKVDGLGCFIEIEAIGTRENSKRDDLLEQCRHYLQCLNITESELIECSYSDMIICQLDNKHEKFGHQQEIF